MATEFKAETKTWWIAHNNDDVVHCGELEEGHRVTTGQPEFETFDNVEDWEARVVELGGELPTEPDLPPGMEDAEFEEVE
jgi:hypothetical protein